MPTASSIPGWAGYASYMQGQQRATFAPNMNFRGTSMAGTRGAGIGPVDPGDPSNPLNDPATGGINTPHPGIPFNPGPVVNIPTFTGGPGQTATGGQGGGGFPSYISPLGTAYTFNSPMGYFMNPSGYPRAMAVNPYQDPYGLSGGGGGGYAGGGVGGFGGGYGVFDMTGIGGTLGTGGGTRKNNMPTGLH